MQDLTTRTAVIVTLLGCLLLGSLFFYSYYLPNRKVLDEIAGKIKEAKQNLRLKTAEINRIQGEIAEFDASHTHVNFFNRLPLTKAERIPYLLKSLTNEANKHGIKFISVDPQQPENKPHYEKYPFQVEVRAAQYQELLSFFNCLEHELKLNIDQLHLQADEDGSNRLRAKLVINSLEMHESKIQDFDSLAQIRDYFLNPNLIDSLEEGAASWSEEAQPRLIMARAAQRNPFVQTIPTTLISHTEQQEKALPVKKDNQELKLRAIMDFEGERIALLGHDRLKKGQLIKDVQIGEQYLTMTVLQIKDDSVILGDGQNHYVLKMPDNPIKFK